MAPDAPSIDTILLDACCVLNLYAGRCLHSVLRAALHKYAVAERVVAEALYVRNPPATADADPQEDREAVDLQPLIAEGLLSVLTTETEREAAAFVRFATQLDDGEAMTCALASERGLAVATDDRKAQRVLRSIVPAVP